MQCISVWSQRNLMCLFLANFLPPEPAEPEGNCPPRFFCRIRNKKMFHQNILYDSGPAIISFLDTNYKFSKFPKYIQEGRRIGSGAEGWKGREKLLPLPKILAELEAKNIPSFMYLSKHLNSACSCILKNYLFSLTTCLSITILFMDIYFQFLNEIFFPIFSLDFDFH